MKPNKVFLYIENQTKDLLIDTLEALHIIDAVTDSFSICGLGAESVLNFKEIKRRISLNFASLEKDYLKGFKIFDDYDLSDNLLIVSIGNQAIIKIYVANRLKGFMGQYGWHIINSTYARIGFLGVQNNLSDFVPFDTLRWVSDLVDKYGEKTIIESLNSLSESKVLVLGEAILDQYLYCDALGKVTKDPLVAFELRSEQKQVGGALAVARHFNGLSVRSNLITKWSLNDQDFIMSELESCDHLTSYNLTSKKSITKTRFVDRSTNSKVFETYELPAKNDYLTPLKDIKKLIQAEKIEFDHLVIMDYGHNFFDHSDVSRYLDFNVPVTVNTQSNAGNRGFNPISNYVGADIVFLNGSEVQIEMRDSEFRLEQIITNLGERLDCKELYVTNGSAGVTSWHKNQGVMTSPTFAPRIIDRMGAGDALLATVSSLRLRDVPIDISTFFGNIAGSLLVGVMGNERFINSNDLKVEAERILKRVNS